MSAKLFLIAGLALAAAGASAQQAAAPSAPMAPSGASAPAAAPAQPSVVRPTNGVTIGMLRDLQAGELAANYHNRLAKLTEKQGSTAAPAAPVPPPTPQLPVAQVVPKKPVAPPARARFVGSYGVVGDMVAEFALPDGRVATLHRGDMVEGWRVDAVRGGEVFLSHPKTAKPLRIATGDPIKPAARRAARGARAETLVAAN